MEVQNAERRAHGAAQEAMMAMESNRTHLQSSSKRCSRREWQQSKQATKNAVILGGGHW